MNHVMLDLETISSRNDAAIASIGAVYFDMETGELGKELHLSVDLSEQTDRRHFNGDTVMWWLNQSREAQQSLLTNPIRPAVACEMFADFYYGAKHLWSHATFDAVVLRSFYEEFSKKQATNRYGRAPWHYREARDIRTLNAIAHMLGYKFGPEVGSQERGIGADLTAHDALADAKRQVIYCTEMYRFIKENK